MSAWIAAMLGTPETPPPSMPWVDLRRALLCANCEAVYDHDQRSCPRCQSRVATHIEKHLGTVQ